VNQIEDYIGTKLIEQNKIKQLCMYLMYVQQKRNSKRFFQRLHLQTSFTCPNGTVILYHVLVSIQILGNQNVDITEWHVLTEYYLAVTKHLRWAPEASFLKQSWCLHGKLAPTQQWLSAQLARRRKVGAYTSFKKMPSNPCGGCQEGSDEFDSQ
jgi:hypothetical protein